MRSWSFWKVKIEDDLGEWCTPLSFFSGREGCKTDDIQRYALMRYNLAVDDMRICDAMIYTLRREG